MVTVLKNTVPVVIKACPEVTVNDKGLSREILKYSFQNINPGGFVWAVVADSHSANVNAFNILPDKFEGD